MYVEGNPLLKVDPNGLDSYTAHGGINVPFVGGGSAGLVIYDSNGLDIGLFCSIKKSVGGLALAKATIGVSQTLGDRSNFEGTDTEACVGLGDVGGCIGGVGDGVNGNESLALEVGPQLGYEENVTHTWSYTARDLINDIRDLFR